MTILKFSQTVKRKEMHYTLLFQIVAVSLNDITYPGDSEKKKEYLRNVMPQSLDNNYKQTYTPIENVNDSVDLFFKFNVDKIFTIELLSVDMNYQESGLAEEIIRKTEELAKQNQFKVNILFKLLKNKIIMYSIL